jgi:beta-hydroxylase
MFYPTDQYSYAAMLEENWGVIRDDYNRLAATDFMAWPERHLYDKGWAVFGLYAFGRAIPQNCKLCPATTRIIESIPGMVTAGFSQMAPGTHIAPHCGYTSAVLRCHLGIIVPEGCALRVGAETRAWEQGKCLIFDDTVEHEAWNRAQTHRTVLLMDIQRSGRNAQIAIPASVAATVAKLTAQK